MESYGTPNDTLTPYGSLSVTQSKDPPPFTQTALECHDPTVHLPHYSLNDICNWPYNPSDHQPYDCMKNGQLLLLLQAEVLS